MNKRFRLFLTYELVAMVAFLSCFADMVGTVRLGAPCFVLLLAVGFVSLIGLIGEF